MKHIINIKVDVNDADFRYIKLELLEHDISDIMLMIDALKKFKPYKSKNKDTVFGLTHEHRHNFSNGGRYGFTTCRNDMGEKSTYTYYVKNKKLPEKAYNTFKKYVKEKTFHTIHQIKIDKEIVFKKERW